eukprot:scaffold31771_cov129-Isochrysis_galbana.AAC.5
MSATRARRLGSSLLWADGRLVRQLEARLQEGALRLVRIGRVEQRLKPVASVAVALRRLWRDLLLAHAREGAVVLGVQLQAKVLKRHVVVHVL